MSPPATQNQEPAGLTACPAGYRHPNCDPQGECLGDWEPRGFYWGWGQGWGLHLGVPSPCYCRVSRQDHADPDVPSPAAAPGGDTAEEPAPDPAGDRDPVVTLPLSMTPPLSPLSLPAMGTPLSPLPLATMGTSLSPLPLAVTGIPLSPPSLRPGDGDPKVTSPCQAPLPGCPKSRTSCSRASHQSQPTWTLPQPIPAHLSSEPANPLLGPYKSDNPL